MPSLVQRLVDVHLSGRPLATVLCVAAVWQLLAPVATAQTDEFGFPANRQRAPALENIDDGTGPTVLHHSANATADGASLTGELQEFDTQVQSAVADEAAVQDEIERALRQRLLTRPKDSSAWRMAGRLRLQRGDIDHAYESFQMAVNLDPLNVAAHCDLGLLFRQQGRWREAREHLRTVVELAPDSEYAADARAALAELPGSAPLDDTKPESDEAATQQAGYEVTQFNGTDPVSDQIFHDERVAPPTRRPFSFWLESGVLYNSNVALTPISRELAPESSASAQVYFSPDLEVYAVDKPELRTGPTMRGYFSLNGSDFSNFNVQDYEPGWFVEWSLFGDQATFVPRVAYSFLHDELGGETFGNRHAVTASMSACWNNGQKSLVYWSIDDTNYTNDGQVPSISSRDGFTNSIGLSHKWLLRKPYLESIRAGVDGQVADLDGSDFAYNGISVYGGAEVPLAWSCSWVIQGGWGYRNYYAYEFTPSRNENIWQAGTELRKQVNDWLRIAAVLRYDRFDSENVLFEAERLIAGVTTTIEF